ncbi:MAG: hypothetical protein KME46_09895 [Brasilonema angustatum HA4187-MV1]|jgi:hypothetical protein|nr:hypothetical protein [Brasilonema angustatum HA4187-MV1]
MANNHTDSQLDNCTSASQIEDFNQTKLTQRIAIAGKIVALAMVISINGVGFGLIFSKRIELGVTFLSSGGFLASVECLKLTQDTHKRKPR